jgi:LmbE family N-acetylglucosaminyl deacetylase
VHPDRTGTLLGVWAHPDDEAFLSAGLMALARDTGERVVVVTATAGEQGAPDPADRGHALGRRRRRELRASLAAVGVQEHTILGVPDGECAAVPPGDGASLVRRWIAAVRPDTIVTFGPEGMTGHGDHRAVHRWVTDAWRQSGEPGTLLYATLTPAFHGRWGQLNEQVGLWEHEPPSTAEADVTLTVDCTPVIERKMAALDAHASQTAALAETVGHGTLRDWWATEWFVAATRRRTARDAGGRLAVAR